MSRRGPRITRPCPKRWDDLSPAPGGRHCETCDRVVVDAGQLTRAELEALTAKGEPVCGYAPVLPDGTVASRDDPRSRRRTSALSGGLAAVLAVSAIACAPGAETGTALPVDSDVTSESPEESQPEPELTDEQREALESLLGYIA